MKTFNENVRVNGQVFVNPPAGQPLIQHVDDEGQPVAAPEPLPVAYGVGGPPLLIRGDDGEQLYELRVSEEGTLYVDTWFGDVANDPV